MTTARDLVNRYYEAFRHGDVSTIPIAEDIVFTCPLPTVHGAEAFRQAVGASAAMLRSVDIDHQAQVDDRIISIGSLDFGLPDGPVRFAETITVTDDRLAAVDLIFDSARLAPSPS